MNTAARIVTRTSLTNHITPVLKSLHWLPVVQRCAFKTALLTFKVIHGLAPSYLSDLVRYRSTFRDLRSVGDVLLDVPSLNLVLVLVHLFFLLQSSGIACLMMFALVFL